MFNLNVLSQNVFLMPEDSESENEEVNDRLEGTFWCTCERCETMPTQRECVCCREQPESEDKMEGKDPIYLRTSKLQDHKHFPKRGHTS